MAKQTRIQAWDHTHDLINHITVIGSTDPVITVNEGKLRDSLDKLYNLNLPNEAIHEIANVILASYGIGKERNY